MDPAQEPRDTGDRNRLASGKGLVQKSLAIGLWLAVATIASVQPAAPAWFITLAVIYSALLFRWPQAWWLALPGALAAFDLTPWSGLRLWDELDLLVLLTMAYGLWTGCYGGVTRMSRSDTLILVALLIIFAIAGVRGLWLADSFTVSLYSHYYGPLGVLQSTKGVLYAILLYPLLFSQRTQLSGQASWQAWGMITGLAVCGIIILWERSLFTGLGDVSQQYRVSGLFSSMHIGGAALDAFLVMCLPFAATLYFSSHRKGLQFAALGLFGLGIYSLMVTYSRTNYAAMAVMSATALACAFVARRRAGAHLRRSVQAGVALVLALCIATPIMLGDFAQRRLAAIPQDVQGRLAHWSFVNQSLTEVGGNPIWGAGAGTVSRGQRMLKQAKGIHVPELLLLKENEELFIRMTRSDQHGNLFLRQRLRSSSADTATLTIRARSLGERPGRLLIEFCEMNILRARPECPWLGINLDQAAPGEWADYQRVVPLAPYWDSTLGFSRPVDIVLLNRGLKSPIDLSRVSLVDASGENLLEMTGFQADMGQWLFNSGSHLHWHAKNLFLHIYFETGLLGLLVIGYLVLRAVIASLDGLKLGDRIAPLRLVALSGFLTVGFVDSLIDDPRIALLFFLLLFSALAPHRR